MKNIKIILLGLVLVSILILSGCGNSSNNDTVIPTGNIGANVGDIAPDFTLNDVDGNSYTLSQFKGKPVLLAYFATWCTPCQIEANTVKQVDDETGGNKFAVYQIGVDDRENLNDLKQFKSGYGNNDWIIGFGFDVAEQYNVRTLDTTLIIDEDGIIVYRDNGIPANADVLRKWLK